MVGTESQSHSSQETLATTDTNWCSFLHWKAKHTYLASSSVVITDLAYVVAEDDPEDYNCNEDYCTDQNHCHQGASLISNAAGGHDL